MTSEIDFFSLHNTISHITEEDKNQPLHYLEAIKAFVRISSNSVYVVDYKQKAFEYVSENSLFLCGRSAREVKKLGYAFYFKHVIPEDQDLLFKINTVGFDFYDKLPVEERISHTISYDFHLKNLDNKVVLINQKLTPLYLTDEGKLWKAICFTSLSSAKTSGNIKIYKHGSNKLFEYDMTDSFWKTTTKVKLTNREKEILRFSIKGYTISEIADTIFVSPNTVKFHRHKLFSKFKVSTVSEAIAYATNNDLIV